LSCVLQPIFRGQAPVCALIECWPVPSEKNEISQSSFFKTLRFTLYKNGIAFQCHLTIDTDW